jgi:hypothetical protein
MRYLLLILGGLPNRSNTRFKSGHPEAGGIEAVAQKRLGDLLNIAGDATDQPDTGSLKHPVKHFADTAANDGIGVQFFYNLEPLGRGEHIKSNLPPVDFGLPLVIDDQQTGACIQHR